MKSNEPNPQLPALTACGLLLLAVAGLAASVLAVIVSYLNAVGDVPPALFMRAGRFSTLRRVSGVPIEFGLVLVFAAHILIIVDGIRARHSHLLVRAFGLGILALSATLVLGLAHARCLSLWVAVAASAGILIISSTADERSIRGTLNALAEDVRSASHPSALRTVATFVLAAAVAAQFIAHRTTSVPRAQADAKALLAWFSSQRPLHLDELRPSSGARLVVFTDYQCSVCAALVPQFRSVVSGLRLQGNNVEIVTRDFPARGRVQ